MVRDYLPVGFLNKIVGKLGISAEKFKKNQWRRMRNIVRIFFEIRKNWLIGIKKGEWGRVHSNRLE